MYSCELPHCPTRWARRVRHPTMLLRPAARGPALASPCACVPLLSPELPPLKKPRETGWRKGKGYIYPELARDAPLILSKFSPTSHCLSLGIVRRLVFEGAAYAAKRAAYRSIRMALQPVCSPTRGRAFPFLFNFPILFPVLLRIFLCSERVIEVSHISGRANSMKIMHVWTKPIPGVESMAFLLACSTTQCLLTLSMNGRSVHILSFVVRHAGG
jgi:hypothetical protein